jgi:hypothetical protein
MTLQEARNLAATLAPKQPGHLITAADWNALVSVLLEYGTALDGLPTRITAAEAAIAALDTRVDALDGLPARVQALEADMAPLRANYRLSVRTTAENFVVGQVAELVFRVTALNGSPLTAPMPWLDVVTTWGRLRAAPGFTVKPNAEENAISVQFNSAGEARVQLRSQFTRGFSGATEAAFGTALQAQAGGTGKTVQQALQSAPSPQDADSRVAFQTLHAAYDANPNVRNYADGYVSQLTGGTYQLAQGGFVFQAGEWEEYRATVMAFAKPDANPTTPDPTRGVATVQVTFREWITSWSNDYVHEFDFVLPQWQATFEQHRRRPDLPPFAVNELRKRGQPGVLGQVRELFAFEKAAEQIKPGTDPLVMQNQVLLLGAAQAQMAVSGLGTEVAESYAQQAHVSLQTSQTAQTAQAQAQDAQSTKQAVQVLEGRVKSMEQTGKEVNAALKNIGDGVNKINIAEVADLGGHLNKINLQLIELGGKIGG